MNQAQTLESMGKRRIKFSTISDVNKINRNAPFREGTSSGL